MAASASSSSSSSSSSRQMIKQYDVFLSFRGEDTRKTFIDHLYVALHQKGIVTFQDDENIVRGKSIRPELLKVIGESSIAIIIFSKNYGSSSWCLDELLEIMKHQKEMKQIVYPVFYGVDPSDVRKQIGVFGEGFARHQGEKVELWREALMEAANLSGWDTKEIVNGHEAECVKAIVKDIQSTLYHKYSILEDKLIGIVSRVEKVKSLLRMGSDDVRMIGIWGMGGAGKTTIARSVFRELRNHFDSASFVRNVREITKKSGLHSVQKELLLSVDKNIEIEDVPQGTQMIRKMFCRQKVLIVLDDIDQISQLDALAGDHNWFGEGSRIIITTRNERLLVAHEINKDIYNVDLLNDDEGLQLFSLYAFRMNSPIKEYKLHSCLIVHYAGGHPLTLKVLGNALRGRDMKKWVTTLDRLKEIPKPETLETLRVSFDALEETEKEIFLDIACFFKGWHKMKVYKILDSCGFDTEKWVSDLIHKSLVYISNERLDMHDMIQEMGHHIVRGKKPKEPHKHSRVWIPREVLDILTENKGTEKIQAIVVEGTLYCTEFLNFSHAFKNMKNLRLLHVDTMGMHFKAPKYLPSSLKYLDWKNYSESSLPASFGSGNLVGLRMQSSSIAKLWKGVKYLCNLKLISCSESKKLRRTPDFTGVPNLEKLYLSGCSNLVKVHESIGALERLVTLDLSYCYRLRSFPSYITMKSLKVLSFCHCKNLKKFPEIQGKMDRLSKLYLNHTAIRELPSSVVNLPNLSILNLFGCVNLESLPQSIGMLQNLTYLDVRYCIKLATLPQGLGNIRSLRHLFLSTVTQLPFSIIYLRNLKTFSAEGPPFSVPMKRGVLGWFSARASLFSRNKNSENNNNNLRGHLLYEALLSLPSLTALKELELSNIHEDLILLVDIGTLYSLKNLVLCYNQFNSFPFCISQNSALRRLNLSNCPRLEALPQLPPSVAVLFANNCKSLKTITGFSSAQGLLRQASFLGCKRLEDQLLDTLTAMVLRTALEGHNVLKHQTSILLPGSEIPNWFEPEATGAGQTFIELPPNWHNVVTGISVCVVADSMGLTRPVSLTLSTEHIASKNRGGFYRADRLHTWMEYASFVLLQHSCQGVVQPDWITTPGLLLTISTESSGVKICGLRLIYKDFYMEEMNTMDRSIDNAGHMLMRQTDLLKCYRHTEYDAITYTLQPGLKYVPAGGDATFESLSWDEKHTHFRLGKSIKNIEMATLI